MLSEGVLSEGVSSKGVLEIRGCVRDQRVCKRMC